MGSHKCGWSFNCACVLILVYAHIGFEKKYLLTDASSNAARDCGSRHRRAERSVAGLEYAYVRPLGLSFVHRMSWQAVTAFRELGIANLTVQVEAQGTLHRSGTLDLLAPPAINAL